MSLRRPAALAAAIVATALATAAPALADSPSNPFAPGLPPSTGSTTAPATPTVAPTSTSSSGGGLSGGAAVAIGIGAIVLLGGIGLFIFRDARRHAPVRARAATAGGVPAGPGEGRPGSKARPKARKLSPAERRRRKRGRAR